MEDKFDYFEIDPDRLCEEWLQQTKIFRSHARLLADAQENLARMEAREEIAKAEKKEVEARLTLDIKMNPIKYNLVGIDRITEKITESAVLLQPDYKAAQQKCFQAAEDRIQAKHAVDLHKADVDTLRSKKTALENAVQLELSKLWGEPKLRDNPYPGRGHIGEVMEEAAKQSAMRYGQMRRSELRQNLGNQT